MDIKKIYALGGLVLVLMVLSFNNCLKGGIDTRPQIDVYKSFLETNPLHWRPNRLAYLSCFRFNFHISGSDNKSLDGYKYPAFITWHQKSDGSSSLDPYPVGLTLSPEAKAFFKTNKILPRDQMAFLTAQVVSPFLYIQAAPDNSNPQGKVSSGLFNMNGYYTGQYNYNRDSKLSTNDFNSFNLSLGNVIPLNPMFVHLPSGTQTSKEIYLGLGFQKASYPNIAQSLFTISTSDGEHVAGHSLRLSFESKTGDDNKYVTPGLRELTSSSGNADYDITAFDTFGDFRKEKGESSQAGFRHDWECKNYVVTRSNLCTSNATVPDIIEAESPFRTSGTPVVVSGFTGSYNGLPCFKVTNEFNSNNSCYGWSGADPVEFIKDKTLPITARDWYAVLNEGKISTAFLAYCKRKTY